MPTDIFGFSCLQDDIYIPEKDFILEETVQEAEEVLANACYF